LERDEWLRAAWKAMVAQEIDARSLVFVDEMGTNISLSPIYGWAKKGERAYCSVPRNRGKNTTLISSMSVKGMGPSLVVEGATNREVFETYVEQILAPTLHRGQVVVMDNLLKLIGESGLGSPSRGGGASSSTCRPTRPTSTLSRKLLPRSRASCAKPKLVAERLYSRRWAQRSRRLVLKTLTASSSTAATGCRSNHYGERCRCEPYRSTHVKISQLVTSLGQRPYAPTFRTIPS
jgi:hypothetical protein